MMRKTRIKFELLALVLLSTSGCGNGAADPDLQESYALISGEISLREGVANPKAARVALGWIAGTGGDENWNGAQAIRITQDIEITTGFPAQFQLNVTELPPQEVMYHFEADDIAAQGLSPENSYAIGEVLVYDDLNLNGTLDFTPHTAPAIVDKLLGHALYTGAEKSTYHVFYWEGPLPPADFWDGLGANIQQGFNLIYYKTSSDPEVFWLVPVHLPLETNLNIQIKGDPKMSCYLVEPLPTNLDFGIDAPLASVSLNCENNQPYSDGVPLCQEEPYGFYMSMKTLEPSPAIANLCGPVNKLCTVWADFENQPIMLPDPPPADWPCLANE